tara:strand:+ start:202 stop:513 length:312 start_codon:yes stop_codon:yes gene_type:complete
MKTKFNNFFAFVGFVTCFILACTASVEIMDDIEDLEEMQTSGTTNVDVTLENDYGKYQIINYTNTNGAAAMLALNTETGNVKYYFLRDGMWNEDTKYNITLTH